MAENLRVNQGSWYSLGVMANTKTDYLKKVLRSQGCEITTRVVAGTKQLHVYARYTGEIKVRTRG